MTGINLVSVITDTPSNWQAIREKDGHLRQQKWVICPICKAERWVRKDSRQRLCFTGRCRKCSGRQRGMKGKNHPLWKGGRYKTPEGYIMVRLPDDDFFRSMAAGRGYVREHRLVVAQALNRCLLPWEVVHHKGIKYPLGSIENKSDNRYPENLQLLRGNLSHNAMLDKWCRKLQKENAQLRQRILELSKCGRTVIKPKQS